MNKITTRAKRLAAALAALAVVSPAAFADLPAGVSTAVTGASTDGGTLVGLMAAGGAAVFLIYKLLKKFGISF